MKRAPLGRRTRRDRDGNARKVCVHCRLSLSRGKFQGKLDAALGMEKEDDDFNTLETPLLSREDHGRVQEALLVNPFHEGVAREVAESPDLLKPLSR